MAKLQDSIIRGIKDVNSGSIGDAVTAKNLFENLVAQADAECAPLLKSGNTNYARIINDQLAELRTLIKSKFPDVASAAPSTDEVTKIVNELQAAGPDVIEKVEAAIHK